jgi:hypothetical protein
MGAVVFEVVVATEDVATVVVATLVDEPVAVVFGEGTARLAFAVRVSQ